MSPNRGSEKSYLRDDSGVRRAARLVIDEFGDTTLDVLHVESGPPITQLTWGLVNK